MLHNALAACRDELTLIQSKSFFFQLFKFPASPAEGVRHHGQIQNFEHLSELSMFGGTASKRLARTIDLLLVSIK